MNYLIAHRHVRLQDEELVVKLPVEPRLVAGLEEAFSVQLAKLIFFDAQSGARVR